MLTVIAGNEWKKCENGKIAFLGLAQSIFFNVMGNKFNLYLAKKQKKWQPVVVWILKTLTKLGKNFNHWVIWLNIKTNNLIFQFEFWIRNYLKPNFENNLLFLFVSIRIIRSVKNILKTVTIQIGCFRINIVFFNRLNQNIM